MSNSEHGDARSEYLYTDIQTTSKKMLYTDQKIVGMSNNRTNVCLNCDLCILFCLFAIPMVLLCFRIEFRKTNQFTLSSQCISEAIYYTLAFYFANNQTNPQHYRHISAKTMTILSSTQVFGETACSQCVNVLPFLQVIGNIYRFQQ